MIHVCIFFGRLKIASEDQRIKDMGIFLVWLSVRTHCYGSYWFAKSLRALLSMFRFPLQVSDEYYGPRLQG